MDKNTLLGMGFTEVEINHYMNIVYSGGKFTPSALQSYGYNFEQAKRLSYLNNVCQGKVSIDSDDQKVKHLKKMFGGEHKITIQDLATSSITDVPRLAVVANIMQSPYDIWNSKNYKGVDALYRVIDTSGQKVTVITDKKPVLKYGAAKKIPGMLEIRGVKENGRVVVTFDKKYCALCNRFIVVASTRNPEFHCGKYNILCYEGTRVYVYVVNMGTKEKLHYSMGNQRIYDFGFLPNQIKPKLDNVAKWIYKKIGGVEAKFENANQVYRVVDVQSNQTDGSEEDDII